MCRRVSQPTMAFSNPDLATGIAIRGLSGCACPWRTRHVHQRCCEARPDLGVVLTDFRSGSGGQSLKERQKYTCTRHSSASEWKRVLSMVLFAPNLGTKMTFNPAVPPLPAQLLDWRSRLWANSSNQQPMKPARMAAVRSELAVAWCWPVRLRSSRPQIWSVWTRVFPCARKVSRPSSDPSPHWPLLAAFDESDRLSQNPRHRSTLLTRRGHSVFCIDRKKKPQRRRKDPSSIAASPSCPPIQGPSEAPPAARGVAVPFPSPTPAALGLRESHARSTRALRRGRPPVKPAPLRSAPAGRSRPREMRCVSRHDCTQRHAADQDPAILTRSVGTGHPPQAGE